MDVLIVGRGGGSLEDLWAFNEEVVARSIYHSRIPVISAVGHEINFTISDFVADLRAPTPSAAAEIAVKDLKALHHTVLLLRDRLLRTIRERIQTYTEKVRSYYTRYGLRWPQERIHEYKLRLDDLSRTMNSHSTRLLETLQLHLKHASGRLQAMNPEAVFRRGYSMTTRFDDGILVTDSSSLKREEKIKVQLARGAVRSIVETIETSQDKR